jgi:hypothetical protein
MTRNTKNIIIITNLYTNDKAKAVLNFSDDNVKQAIFKLLKIKPEHLQCEAASICSSIYKVTKEYYGLNSMLRPVPGLENKEAWIQISCATLYE